MLNKYKELLERLENLEHEFETLKSKPVQFTKDELDFIRDGAFAYKKQIHKICEEIKEIARYNTVTTNYDFKPGVLNYSFTTEVRCGNKIYATITREMTFMSPSAYSVQLMLKYKGKIYTGDEIDELHRFLLQLVRKGE